MSDAIKTARQRATAKDAYLEDFLRRAEQYQRRLLKQSELKAAKKQKQMLDIAKKMR
jgi:sporulation-control protein spo0M